MAENDSSTMNDPSQNVLGAGLTIDKVQAAIVKSGYPLQTHVANVLRPLSFRVSPEWSFIDRDNKELRSMDLRATLGLYERGSQTRSRPWLDLLIECKQSEMPFVFFTGEEMPWDARLPFLAGQKKEDFTIYTDDTRSTWSCDLQQALSLRSQPFFSYPPIAYTFSKCQRKGSELILSGEEAYNGIIMPLVKAMHHLKAAEAPPKTAVYFDIHYAVALAVLDAPMVAFESNAPRLAPWVRVLRHEAGSAEHGKNDRGANMVIDIVHRGFLEKYLSDHLLPAAHNFAGKVLAHSVEVAECEAFISGMEANWHDDYEPHLQPKTRLPFLSRPPKT